MIDFSSQGTVFHKLMHNSLMKRASWGDFSLNPSMILNKHQTNWNVMKSRLKWNYGCWIGSIRQLSLGWINSSGKTTSMRLRKNRRTRWTEEERQKLKSLFEKFDGDVDKISQELRRGERSVRMNLFFMDLIKENEVDQRFWIRFRIYDCHVYND